MNRKYRMPIEWIGRTALVIGIFGVLIAIQAGSANAQQQDVRFMGPCGVQNRIVGQCAVYTTDTVSGLQLGSISIFGRIFSEADTVYFDNPYPNSSITVNVSVVSGPAIDIVGLGAPDPAPNTYALKWTTSRGASTNHQIQTTGPSGRYRIEIGPNFASGPGISTYSVTVTVTQTLAAPIPLPPAFRANQCQPPTDLGTLTTGGGLANTRLRNRIELRPGDYDCYEFDLQYSGPFFSSTFGSTYMRFVLNNLPNTGTKFLFLYDMTRGRFPQTWSTTGDAMTKIALLPPGRYRMYVIGGYDGFTSSNYNWSLNTY